MFTEERLLGVFGPNRPDNSKSTFTARNVFYGRREDFHLTCKVNCFGVEHSRSLKLTVGAYEGMHVKGNIVPD